MTDESDPHGVYAAVATGRGTFPVMHGRFLKAVPLAMVAGCERRARLNHGGQTLTGLAMRGGLSPCECLAVLEDRAWCEDAGAEIKLMRLVVGEVN